MRVAEADFPRKAGILDRRERRCARAAVEAADRDDVRACFCNARSDDSHSRAGNELHADARARIHGTQIVNQLREVFDAVNIVMRRRRN